MQFIETSAVENTGLDDAFSMITEAIVRGKENVCCEVQVSGVKSVVLIQPREKGQFTVGENKVTLEEDAEEITGRRRRCCGSR